MNSETTTSKKQERIKRRAFFKKGLASLVGVSAVGLGYSLFEAGWLRVKRTTIAVPHLPKRFRGTTIAFLSDLHHGPYTHLEYIHEAVQLTNSLSPDAILLGGDYVHRGSQYIEPCIHSLAKLTSRWGTYGVLGNHDHWHGAQETRAAMREAGVVDLSNSGSWIQLGSARLRLSGVGDLWEDHQDLVAALEDTKETETAILVSHNPDYVESITDPRVGLVLSGHTHGGQVVLPVVGAPRVPSSFGQKYLYGLVKTPHTQVFVTRGLGTVTPPVRFCCRPEIALVTIV